MLIMKKIAHPCHFIIGVFYCTTLTTMYMSLKLVDHHLQSRSFDKMTCFETPLHKNIHTLTWPSFLLHWTYWNFFDEIVTYFEYTCIIIKSTWQCDFFSPEIDKNVSKTKIRHSWLHKRSSQFVKKIFQQTNGNQYW